MTRDEIEEFFGMIEDEGVVPVQHVHAMRGLALRGLEAGEPEILAQHSGKTTHREWHSVGTWLYPGEAIANINVAPQTRNGEQERPTGEDHDSRLASAGAAPNPPPEHDLITLCLRLCMEPSDSHSPDTLAVLNRWRPAWEAAAEGVGFDDALSLVVKPATDAGSPRHARGAGTAVEEVRRMLVEARSMSPDRRVIAVDLALRHAEKLDRKTEEVAALRAEVEKLKAENERLVEMGARLVEDCESLERENAKLKEKLCQG